MGKRRKGGDAPATDTWSGKSPQEKADAFDASYAAHSGPRPVIPPALPEQVSDRGGDVGIPARGPSVPDGT